MISVVLIAIGDDTTSKSTNRVAQKIGLPRTTKKKGEQVDKEEEDDTNDGPNKHL